MPTTITINLADLNKLGIVQSKLKNGIVAAIAEWLRYIIRSAFETQASPEGVSWAPLSVSYQAQKELQRPGRRILELSGALFEQATRGPIITGSTITAESTLPYAGAQQYGASIAIPEMRPKKIGGALRFYNANGDAVFARRVRAHTVNIPARPYFPTAAFAEEQGAQIAEESIQGMINEAGAGPQ